MLLMVRANRRKLEVESIMKDSLILETVSLKSSEKSTKMNHDLNLQLNPREHKLLNIRGLFVTQPREEEELKEIQ